MACGGVAGAAAGVVGAATLGCVMVLLDGLPRMLLGVLNLAAGPSAAALSPGVATPLWLLFALGCWTLVGAGLGLLLGGLGGAAAGSWGPRPRRWPGCCGRRIGGLASLFLFQCHFQ